MVRGLSAGAAFIVGAVVLAAPGGSQVESGKKTRYFVYSVTVSGTLSAYSPYNQSVVQGTASETLSWTATYPRLRLAVRPTRAFARQPASYELSGRAAGAARVDIHYVRQGPYEQCDWQTSYQWPMKTSILGYPDVRLYYLRMGDFGNTRDVPPQGCDQGDIFLGVPMKDAATGLDGSAEPRGSYELGGNFRTPQGRKHLPLPIRRFSAGKSFALQLRGSWGSDGERHSGTLSVSYKRK